MPTSAELSEIWHMRKKVLIGFTAIVLLVIGLSTFLAKESANEADIGTDDADRHYNTERIISLLTNNSIVEEIENPGLVLPRDINEGQIRKYFKMDDIMFALVLNRSMNVALSLPRDFTPVFTGVLVAGEGDSQWFKLLEIKDEKPVNRNNPYYLVVENQRLLLTVVDLHGGGSGEGIMKVFALYEGEEWQLESCYYFGSNYGDPDTDGDYFAHSIKFSEQIPQEIEKTENCRNAQLI